MTYRIFSIIPSRDFHFVQELRERGYDAYSPAETVWHGPATNRKPTKRPIIPGYVFADLTEEQTAEVCQLQDVQSLIWPKGYEQALISQALAGFVEQIRTAERNGDFDKTRRTQKAFSPGDRVRIIKGTFMGYLATISELRGKKEAEVLLPFSVSNGAPMTIKTSKLEHEAA